MTGRSLLLTLLFSLACPAALAGTPQGDPAPVSFLNDVLPVLSKLGCNQGTCHGGAAGRGGFKLSLRGFAPELDYESLCRQESGRRINLLSPDESLILLKPTLAVPHQGGRALDPDSAAHRVLLDWVRQGAPGPSESDPRPEGLEIEPPSRSFEVGDELRLRVHARFSDGTRRDVTPWSRFDTNDASVVAPDAGGLARALAPGQAALSAAYQDQVAAARLIVPYPSRLDAAAYAALERSNYIDDLIIEQWRELGLWPSAPADDATFLRRVYLDLTGTLPPPEEVRRFLGDPDPKKRETLLDRLLDGPGFAEMWTQKWSDIFRVSREWIGEKSVWTMHRWLHDQIRRNAPWDRVVRELVAGAGDSSREGPPNFYRLQKVFNEAELWPLTAAETTAQTFLGVRIQCARCHNHPFDRWTQADYYGMASLFARVGSKTGDDGGVIVFTSPSGEIVHPRLGRALEPKALGGPVAPDDPSLDRRAFLAAWMTAPDNPFFARATSNRVWRHLMGRGLVEPVDDLRPSNPPSNAPLLDRLALDLTEHGYDIKHLIRTIVRSRAYQLSSTPTDANRADSRFYSHYLPRRMTAEQLLDALADVTGQPERFAGVPGGFRAQQLPDTKFASSFLDAFGRPLRRVASCECERVQEPNLGQALELMHNPALHERVTSGGALVNRLLGSGAADSELLGSIYLACLGRPPTEAERVALLSEQAAGLPGSQPAGRREFFEDLLWAVVNSKEFLFNH